MMTLANAGIFLIYCFGACAVCVGIAFVVYMIKD